MPSKCLLMVRDPQGWWSCGYSQLGHGDGGDTKLLPYASDLVTTQVGGDFSFRPRGTGICT
jgi:hypothetical protein